MNVNESTSIRGYTYTLGGDRRPEWVRAAAAALACGKAHVGLHILKTVSSSRANFKIAATDKARTPHSE